MDSLIPTLAGDFEHPMEMLDACHQRIRRNCQLIERLAAHLASRPVDAEARDVARFAMRFFDTAAEAHHRDEEIDLFIAVERYVPSRELNATRSLLHRLRSDHRRIAALWADMRPRLEAVSEGRDGGLTPAIAAAFAEVQSRHIELEESQLLPLARRVLDEHALARLGAAMAERRAQPAP